MTRVIRWVVCILSPLLVLLVAGGCATEALQRAQRAKIAALPPWERGLMERLMTLRHPKYPGDPLTDWIPNTAVVRDGQPAPRWREPSSRPSTEPRPSPPRRGSARRSSGSYSIA